MSLYSLAVQDKASWIFRLDNDPTEALGTGLSSSTCTITGSPTIQLISATGGTASYLFDLNERLYFTGTRSSTLGGLPVFEAVVKLANVPNLTTTNNRAILRGESSDGFGSRTLGIRVEGYTGICQAYFQAANTGTTTYERYGGPNLNDGQWHHIMAIESIVNNNTKIDLYVDGSLVSTGSSTTNIGRATPNNVYVGGRPTSAPTFDFPGIIDFGAIYSQGYLSTPTFDSTYITNHYNDYVTTKDSYVAPSVLPYPTQISALGPKIWYKFNETAGSPVNSGSTQNTLTAFGSPLLNEQTDVDGRAVYLNGTSHYSFSDMPEFTLFDDRSFTVETWFKTTSGFVDTQASDMTLWNIRGRTSTGSSGNVVDFGLGINISGTNKYKLNFAPIINSWTGTLTSSASVADDKWHHAVATFNTTNIKLYLNGQLVGTLTPNVSPARYYIDSSTSHVGPNYKLIGKYDATAVTFKGWIDEFAAYDRELTAGEILANFNSGASVNILDISGDASALFVQPTLYQDALLTAAPMTASADGAGHAASTVEFPTLLNTYMSGLGLQVWFKFDVLNQLENYGSGEDSLYLVTGDPINNVTGGIQGSGSWSLNAGDRLTNSSFTGTAPNLYTYENQFLNDEDFAIGFWTKKLTAEEAVIITSARPGSTEKLLFKWNTNGGITFLINANNTDYSVASTSDITDGEWHFVVGKLASNTMELFVDNTSIGTNTMNHGLDLRTAFVFGDYDINATYSDRFSISQFFIATATAIGSTQIANMWDYGTPTFTQAAAYMPPAAAKFNSAFNDYIQSKSPLIDFRMDEGSGVPRDYGSLGLVVGAVSDPVGYTQNNTSLNTRAFNFTKPNQGLAGSYTLPTGTVSDSDVLTYGVLFKLDNKTTNHDLGGFGGGSSTSNGIQLRILTSTGYIEARSGNANSSFTSYSGNVDYADNKWHLAILVQDTNTLKLYVDGKEHISQSRSTAFTDAGIFGIGRLPGTTNTNTTSINKYIDETFVLTSAMTAQEAFEAWQKLRLEMDTTASASFPMVTNIAGTGTDQSVDAATASSEFVMPAFSTDQILDAAPGTASALFVLPNFGGNVVIDANYGHTAATANAVFHDPQFQIGDFHSADHMDASALMVHPISTGGGTIAVPTAVGGPALMVDPGIVTIKGARVFADPARANAILPLPPAYIQLSDDDWYVRLLNAHNDKKIEGVQQQLSSLANQSTTDIVKGGFLTFFDDVNLDITPTTTINTIASEIPAYFFDRPGSYRYDNNGNIIAPSTAKASASASATRNSSNPTPLLSVGYFDDQERRAVRLDNIEFTLPGTDRYYSTRPYNIEFSFKTTKADQIITYGLWNSFLYNGRKIGVIGLFNGKIYLAEDNYVPFTASVSRAVGTQTAPHPKKFTETSKVGYLLGRKRIDDGQWHHVVIQQGWNDGRTQIWIDGELDRQFGVQGELGGGGYSYDGLNGTNRIRPYILGFNSNDPILRSDFQTSAWNFYPGRFIEERDLSLNYQAYSKWEPILPEPMTATLNIGQNTIAKGNRPRAIMLYWWETGPNGNMQHRKFDGDGLYSLDTDTFAQLKTQYDEKGTVQKWYGWDVFPVDILGRYRSPMTKEDVIVSGGYRDPITGAPRYLDIINDLDLSTIDAIFFRNYPDDSGELDEFARDEEADTYFNLKERTLYENFVKSVRSVMDTGISVYITNHQLALDLQIVDRVEIVDDLIDEDTAQWNPHGYTLLGQYFGLSNVSYEQGGASNFKGWYDTWRNNRLRILNTVEGITTQPGIIRNDLALYNPASEEWSSPFRSFASYTQKQSLNVGDTFLIASGTYTPFNTFGNSKSIYMQYYATHKDNVKAGIPVTGFANTYWKNDTEVENPYKDYVTSIALPEGTILNGRAIKSRVFVNFTERINSAFEEGSVELIQDEWIDIAYNVGRISLADRDRLKNDPVNLDRRLEAAIAANNQIEITNINRLKYWDMNGQNLGATSIAVQGNVSDQTANTGGGFVSSAPAGTSNRNTPAPENFSPVAGASWGGGLWFKFQWFWRYPMLRIEVPSMLTRGFRWIAKRIEDDGIVNRTNASTAVADMIMPVVVADKDRTVYAQAAYAGANLVHAPGYALTSVSNIPLPMFAEAKFGDFVKNIKADIMAAEARLRTNIVTTAVETDQVVLYIDHVDPILYIREDIIK